MTQHLVRKSVLTLLGAGVVCLALFVSDGERRVHAGTPDPCEIVSMDEVLSALGESLEYGPDGGEFPLPAGTRYCGWGTENADMGIVLFSGLEEDADILFNNWNEPYSEEVSGIGDRARWLKDFEGPWERLSVRISHYYVSVRIVKQEPESVIKVDMEGTILQMMFTILDRLIPRAPVEFTQVIQELQNNYELSAYLAKNGRPPVPIVAGKPAVARVYFSEVEEPTVRTARMTGVSDTDDTVTVMPGCTEEKQRRQEGGCDSANLYFTPPEGEWKATISILDENDAQLDRMEFTIASVDTPEFGVTYLPICVPLTAGTEPTCPSSYIEGPVSELIRRSFPVAPDEFFYHRMPLPAINLEAPLANDPDENGLIADLRFRWELLSIGSSPTAFSGDQLAGWLPSGGAGTGTVGLADPVWFGSTGRVSWQVDNGATIPMDTQHTLAHEIGHNLGLRHTNKPDGCGAADSNTDWPHNDSTIQEVGFDVEDKEAKPETKKDLMSYCSSPEGNNWISPFTYMKLIEGGFQPQRSGAIPSGDPGQFLLVKGSVKADGSAGSIDSAFVIDSTIPSAPSNPLGEHCLHLTGGAQMDYCFNLTFVEHRSNAPLDEESFVVRVPLPPGTDQAFLMRNGTELDSLELSASVPEVEIMSPQPGAEWSGEQTVEWTASDADGGPLSIAVLYSPDGGANWLPMEVTSGDSEFTFDTRDLTGGEIMLRVLASDGLNTTEDTVTGIALSNGEPGIWGDNDCDGDSDAVDGLKTLQELAGLPYTQSEPCPDLGETVEVTPAGATSERSWGDVDCDGDVDAADGLSILRKSAALPVNQQQPCPAIGSGVLVG